VIPKLLNLSALDKFSSSETEQEILSELNDGYVNLHFIGRIVPNKRQDDLIRLLAYYKQFIDQKIRLLLIGWESYGYKAMLQVLAQELGVSEDVHFIGHLELKDGFAAYYKAASVFVSMSEHEGFGVPLIESMYFDLPVLAYASSAVPEIMGEAGILVTEKRYDVMAEIIYLLKTDPSFRQRIVEKQRERLAYFDRAKTECLIHNWVLEVQEQVVNKGLV
jgi:glycosyltransferase involved in cell wall biosynthesis